MQNRLWIYFLILLLAAMIPMGCSKKASKTHMEVGNETGTLGGRIEVTQDDRTDLAGRAPNRGQTAGAKVDEEASEQKCDTPLMVKMGGQEINFTEYIRSHPVLGWLQEEEQHEQETLITVDICRHFRLAAVTRCDAGAVVEAGKTAEHLKLMFEVAMSGSPIYFEARGSLVKQQLPQQAQFMLDDSVAYQVAKSGTSETFKLSFVTFVTENPPLPEIDEYGFFIDIKQRVIKLPSNSFGIRLSERSDGKSLIFDIDARLSVSTPKRGSESATEQHAFTIIRSNYVQCDPFGIPNNPLPGESKDKPDAVGSPGEIEI